MKILTNSRQMRARRPGRPTGEKSSSPSDSVTLSDSSEFGDKLKIGVTAVAAVAGLAGGFVYGRMGGIIGTVFAAPGGLVLAGAGFTLGAMSDGINGGGNQAYTGLALGSVAGALAVGAGAVGGLVGGVVSGLGLAASTLVAVPPMLPD